MAAIAIPVTGWFVGPVITKIINSCFEYLGMKKELKRLEENTSKIQTVVNHATEAQIGDPALNKWLWQLRVAIEEADDLLDEIEYMKYKEPVAKNSEETKVQSASTSTLFEAVLNLGEIGARFLLNDPILNRLEEVVHNLDKVSADFVTFLPLINNAKEELRREQLDMLENREEGSLPKNDLIGRREYKEYVMRWLGQTSSEEHPSDITSTVKYNNVSILSIVGHGGMGKTTLLQHVYEETKEFDLKMWVCVSNDFHVKKVIINMLESLENKKPEVGSLDALQRRLKSAVSSNKFLLVLDDIWEEEDKDNDIRKWEKVLAPLANGKLGSKILVTTRMDSAAEMITKVIKKKNETLILNGLKDDECLQLLNTHAFAGVENPEDHKKLRSITFEIAKRLSGSPLAAKVIGGALNYSLDERYWITILNSEFGQNDILPILRLSYTFLPRHLQNCFAFCCIFPQDHVFAKDDLVQMWIALGFIQSSTNREETVEDIGGRYFDILVNKSFFDGSSRTHYKMHDLLHKLAQFISAQECFRVVRDKELHSQIPETIRHLSIETKNLEILKQIEKFKRLRSLFIRIGLENQEIVDVLTKIFQSLRSIRLLYINCFSLPEAIGNLIHLRYLKFYLQPLEGTPALPLPSSLSNLYHLQFIIQRGEYCNVFLPRDMNNLLNLRYIEMPQLRKFSGIGKLRSLQELNVFSVKNEVGYSIQELEHMNELRQLRIELLENVKDAEQARKAKLSDKKRLTKLSLDWTDTPAYHLDTPEWLWESETLRNSKDSDLDERVLDNLQPHNSLNELRIRAFMGVRSPIWLNNANLMSNLKNIQLEKCFEWQTLPPFGKLPFLKSLYLHYMPKAKSIDYKYDRNEKDCVFPSLELLHITSLIALEDLFDATITDDCLFPCLTKLCLNDCPNLNELPRLPPKLQSLQIYKIGWKTLSCRSISKSIPLKELTIWGCPNITCISLADNISRFTALRDLTIKDCPNLISLGGHQEVETIGNCLLTLNDLSINNPSMLLMEPLRSIASLQALHITDNEELVSFSSEVEQWFLQVSSFLFELCFERLKSLQCLPSSLSTISSLKSLKIVNVPLLQQLPDLPTSLKSLYIKDCHEELKNRYDKISGFDRDKLAHIPRVYIK